MSRRRPRDGALGCSTIPVRLGAPPADDLTLQEYWAVNRSKKTQDLRSASEVIAEIQAARPLKPPGKR